MFLVFFFSFSHSTSIYRNSSEKFLQKWHWLKRSKKDIPLRVITIVSVVSLHSVTKHLTLRFREGGVMKRGLYWYVPKIFNWEYRALCYSSHIYLSCEFQSKYSLVDSRYHFQIVGLAAVVLASDKDCYWSGTSPFCAGVCRPGEKTVKISSDGKGQACITGQKVYCCPESAEVAVEVPKNGCVWKGLAPFCSGECDSGYKLEKLSDIGDGQPCWTGKKALCCPK